jgi:hypothetical protein
VEAEIEEEAQSNSETSKASNKGTKKLELCRRPLHVFISVLFHACLVRGCGSADHRASARDGAN